MTVSEHADSHGVTKRANTLIFLAGATGNILTCRWPPTGKTINESGTCGWGIRVGVTYKKSVSRLPQTSSLEPLSSCKMDSCNDRILVGLWVESQKVSVVTIADQIPIKRPAPSRSIDLSLFACDGGTAERGHGGHGRVGVTAIWKNVFAPPIIMARRGGKPRIVSM